MAGFDLIGCNEIDKEMMTFYQANHHPKHPFLEPIQTFKSRTDLPDELFNLDVLDGSPPCSSFSMSGNREKDWGKKKKFREGQQEQVLDDLFFHFIDLINKLKPKIVIAENVKGILQGNAKGYIKEIIQKLKLIGYDVQLFLLNAATMGVPQKRERVFFIAKRNYLCFPNLKLKFNENIVLAKDIESCSVGASKLNEREQKLYKWCNENNDSDGGNAAMALFGKRKFFNFVKAKKDNIIPTIVASSLCAHWNEPRFLSNKEVLQASSFPLDFKSKKIPYICGMSVPPLMIYKIVEQIKIQWLHNTLN
jgi:DNA (cytosine-5)-methyltransferase 1